MTTVTTMNDWDRVVIACDAVLADVTELRSALEAFCTTRNMKNDVKGLKDMSISELVRLVSYIKAART